MSVAQFRFPLIPGRQTGLALAAFAVLLGFSSVRAADEVILLPNEDGTTGVLHVGNEGQGALLTDPNSAVKLYYRYLGPYVSRNVSPADIEARFGEITGLDIAPDNPMDTLPEVVELTLATHPSVMQLVHERQMRNEFAEEARRGFRPRLGLVGEAGYEWTRSPGTRARRRANGFDDTQFASLPRREVGFVLRQKLFDGWETRSEVDRRVAAGDSSAYQLLARAEVLSARVSDAYLNLLRDNELLELANRNLATHQAILERIEARTDSGVGRESDLDQAVGRLARAESEAVSSETALMDTMVSYISVVGFPPLDVLNPPDPPTAADLPPTLDEALRIALQRHPSILATEADMAAAQDQIKNARSLLWPRIEVELGTRYGDDLDGVEGFDQDWTARLLFSYNLYNGDADRSKIRRSLNVLEQARDLRERSVRDVTEALRQAWNSYVANERRLAVLERRVEATAKARDAYVEQFRIGDRTLLDVLDSENELFEARGTLVEARRDYAAALYRVRASMGVLVEHFGATVPEEALAAVQRDRTP